MDERNPTKNESDVPESSGSALDRFFWALYPLLPSWLLPSSKFANWISDLLFIDCPYCLGMRFGFLGLILGGLLGVGLTAVGFWLI